MKTVLITGGARRLGRALVQHFAANGWRVLFTAQWSFEEAAEVAKQAGPNVEFLRAEVSSQSNGAVIAQWAAKYTDALDLLVCSASTFRRASLAETTPAVFENVLNSNLLGPYFLIQQCQALLAAAGGCVVNIADAQVDRALPHFSAYGAAKAGLVSITKSLAVELAPVIRVNAVLPGSLQWPDGESEYPLDMREEIVSKIPLKRVGEWDDVVRAVDFLQGSAYQTGVCLPVDGGRAAVY
ncbi:SDR family oxidoreductase (plasmid) [Massilia varians]